MKIVQGIDVEKIGPHVKCSKHGTCRMNCVSQCNTMKLSDSKDEEAEKRWKEKYGRIEFDNEQIHPQSA